MATVEDTLEVGCLHVGLIAVRNIKSIKQGGMSEFFGLTPQHKPYCNITLGEHEFTSGIGVRTTAGYAWNREQIFFPVKVPISCVVGVSGREAAAGGRSSTTTLVPGGRGGLNQGVEKEHGGGEENFKGCGSTGAGGRGGTSGGGGVACGSSLSRAAAAADAAAAHEVWSRLTLRIQVFHREDVSAATVAKPTTTAVGHSETDKGRGCGSKSVEFRTTTTEAAGAAAAATRTTTTITADSSSTPSRATGGAERLPPIANSRGGGDRLLGECSLNLVEVVSGRAPHIEEWVPLDRGGDLRLSLDYDSVGGVPMPGDSVVLLCLSNRLDFFPLPVWDSAAADPVQPGSPTWLWAADASQRRLPGHGGVGGEGGFRVEEAGDDFFLVSYPTPEGWRCAVEVHRFLVYPDPHAPQRWSLSSVRDHAIATPAAAAVRGAILRASHEESVWAGGKELAVDVAQGVVWTAARWWGGGLDRIREDVSFVLGLTDPDSFAQVEESRQNRGREGKEDADEAEDEQDGGGKEATANAKGDSITVPPGLPLPPLSQQQHLCPITRCPMEDPTVAADGFTYERAAIERWLSEHDTSPVTGKVLETKVVFKNWSLVSSISASPSASASTPASASAKHNT